MPRIVFHRALFLAVALLCAGLIATALYFQYVLEMEPCPLCIMQRVVVMAIGLVALVAAIHNPGHVGRRVYGALTVLISATGVAIAARHIWLQNLPPDQVPECGPGLGYILDSFPFQEGLSMILRGSGECAEIHWTFLGLTIPGWTLVMFSAVLLLGIYLLVARSAAPTQSG